MTIIKGQTDQWVPMVRDARVIQIGGRKAWLQNDSLRTPWVCSVLLLLK